MIRKVDEAQMDKIESGQRYYFFIPGGNAFEMFYAISLEREKVIKNATGVIGFCAGAILLHTGFEGSQIGESTEYPCAALGLDFIHGTCGNSPYKFYADLNKNVKAASISCSIEAVQEEATKINNFCVLWASGPKLPESDDGLEVLARYEKDPNNRVAAIVQKGKFIASAVHPEFKSANAGQYGLDTTAPKIKKALTRLSEDAVLQKKLFRFLLQRIGIELSSHSF